MNINPIRQAITGKGKILNPIFSAKGRYGSKPANNKAKHCADDQFV
ncbi:MAG: hypothetical protein WDO19_26695 [Bacteroidota bacterium]